MKQIRKILSILSVLALIAGLVNVNVANAATITVLSDVMTDQTQGQLSSHDITFSLTGVAWEGGEVLRLDLSDGTNPFAIAAALDTATAADAIDVTIAGTASGADLDIIDLDAAGGEITPDCTGALADDIAIAANTTAGSEAIYIKACSDTSWDTSDVGAVVNIEIGVAAGGATNYLTNDTALEDEDAVVQVLLDSDGDTNFETDGSDSLGSFSIPLLIDGTVTVTATVDPAITFDVWTQSTACSADNDTTAVNLGSLPTSGATHATSGVGSVESVCMDLVTNAQTGYTIYVESANNNLDHQSSTATLPADGTSDNVTNLNSSGQAESYGLCVFSVGTAGNGETVSKTAPFDGGCTKNTSSTTDDIGGLTGAQQSLVSTTDDSPNTTNIEVLVKASAIGTTPAGAYADTLTFTAVGNF